MRLIAMIQIVGLLIFPFQVVLEFATFYGAGSTSQNLTGVPSGDYFVTITDDEGCSYTSNVFNVFRQQIWLLI